MRVFTGIRKGISRDKFALIGKLVFCVVIAVWFVENLIISGTDPYVSYREYTIQNHCTEKVQAEGVQRIEQRFTSPGNILSGISLYLGEISDEEIDIRVCDAKGKMLAEKNVNLRGYEAETWNRVSVETDALKRDEEYTVEITGKHLDELFLTGENTEKQYLGVCYLDGKESTDTVVIGLQITYRYFLLGNVLELSVRILFSVMIAIALCFAVWHIEMLYSTFLETDKKQGVFYALYFALHTVLMFNPIDSLRTEVTEFTREIGEGLINGVDVAKRVSNFHQWFICFAVAFCLFFLLANYCRSREFQKENRKAITLLDDVVVAGNVMLVLRCLTFFEDASQTATVFYYSDFLIFLVLTTLISYVVLNVQKYISLNKFEAFLISIWMFALPTSVVVTHEWTLGRVFMGFQVIGTILVFLIVKVIKMDWNTSFCTDAVCIGTVFFSWIPFFTSFYIELITVLNQYGIYIVKLRRGYFVAVAVGIVVTLLFSFWRAYHGKVLKNWKRISYPSMIIGFVCLSQQCPTSTVYSLDFIETANASILIGDFLRYGDIPIVQHYGGHMMTKVWEGILYALINRDVIGATFSPYAGYVAVPIAVAFYYLIRELCGDDVSFLIVLLYPFYNTVIYWGLGLLTVLAVAAYVKKNTYSRAILVWLAMVWCALYRLDIGYAFGCACVAALLIYVIKGKNKTALKQLAVSLCGIGIGGGWYMAWHMHREGNQSGTTAVRISADQSVEFTLGLFEDRGCDIS